MLSSPFPFFQIHCAVVVAPFGIAVVLVPAMVLCSVVGDTSQLATGEDDKEVAAEERAEIVEVEAD